MKHDFQSLIIKFTIFSIFVLFTAEGAFADFDLRLASDYRSSPLSGIFGIQMGYGIPLWGTAPASTNLPGRAHYKNTGAADANWQYGFIRPVIEFEGISQYQDATAQLEVFPISILGVRAGVTENQSHADYSAYPCDLYDCKGEFREDFLEAQTYLGFGPFMLTGSLRRSNFTRAEKVPSTFLAPQGTSLWIEPNSGLPLTGDTSDHMTRARGAVLLKWDENWRIGYFYGSNIEENKDFNSHMWAGILQYKNSGLTIGLGGGEFKSEIKNTDPTVIVNLSYQILPKLGF